MARECHSDIRLRIESRSSPARPRVDPESTLKPIVKPTRASRYRVDTPRRPRVIAPSRPNFAGTPPRNRPNIAPNSTPDRPGIDFVPIWPHTHVSGFHSELRKLNVLPRGVIPFRFRPKSDEENLASTGTRGQRSGGNMSFQGACESAFARDSFSRVSRVVFPRTRSFPFLGRRDDVECHSEILLGAACWHGRFSSNSARRDPILQRLCLACSCSEIYRKDTCSTSSHLLCALHQAAHQETRVSCFLVAAIVGFIAPSVFQDDARSGALGGPNWVEIEPSMYLCIDVYM